MNGPTLASGATTADVVVIGAGLVGAWCTRALARAGLRVCLLERHTPAAGTSSSGEGNLLVSDKQPGPELDLARHSIARWRAFAAEHPEHDFEFETKGGVVVAAEPASFAGLTGRLGQQRAAGVTGERLEPAQLPGVEPLLATDLAGGAFYPQDAQLQPMLAVRALLADAVRLGATVRPHTEVLPSTVDSTITVRTSGGTISTGAVVNAAGVWAAEVARLFGGRAPVRPRRGHILVTEPLPPLVRHKVYEADYVAAVESDDGGLLCSPVVEGTRSGPILIGSSREVVGFDRRFNDAALAGLAQRAARLFPFLREVRAIRAYVGFRPASPDHRPMIGPDERVPGLYHATGHEGAGVGLAPGTADLIRCFLTGERPPLDPAPFALSRAGLTTETVDA